MADPTGYITISDFRPGIHGDLYASTDDKTTASPTLAGAIPGNGVARVVNTERCHADKTGALVPLPKPQLTGPRDAVGPTMPLQPARPYRYVLDAQVGQRIVDASASSATALNDPDSYFTTHVMWGYWGEDNTGLYRPIVIGREYRNWLNILGDVNGVFDFMVGKSIGELP